MSVETASRFETRLNELRSEMASGQEQMRALDARRTQLQETMTRIAGAIQVLEELLAEEKARADM